MANGRARGGGGGGRPRKRNDCNYDIVVELFLGRRRICRCHYFILDVIFMNGHIDDNYHRHPVTRGEGGGGGGRDTEKDVPAFLSLGQFQRNYRRGGEMNQEHVQTMCLQFPSCLVPRCP